MRWRSRRYTYFSGCDYFRLARDPKVAQAARRALAEHGLNVAASRRTTGNHLVYAQLETALAAFFGAETALVFLTAILHPARWRRLWRGNARTPWWMKGRTAHCWMRRGCWIAR